MSDKNNSICYVGFLGLLEHLFIRVEHFLDWVIATPTLWARYTLMTAVSVVIAGVLFVAFYYVCMVVAYLFILVINFPLAFLGILVLATLAAIYKAVKDKR